MPISLRPHQAETQRSCIDILAGAQIRTIIADVTPGGGKSKLPVILASLLIPTFADRLIWVVPRNSLKYQGEAEFLDPRFPTDRRLRATDGNETNPDRGTDGYITTYQAIGMTPEPHADYMRRHRTILVLDENHHVADDATWQEAIAPMVAAACLVVYASGTLARGDGQKIAFLDYAGQHVDLRDREHVKVIRYGRAQAIADKAILPVHGRTIDGAAEWNSKEGIHRKVDSIASAGADRSAALFTALRTEYAYQLLDTCIADWEQTCLEYPDAKLLVVAPDIKFAKDYHRHVARRFLAEIATSDDSVSARRTIEAFKRGVFPVLVTVAMAYEGLSVPEVTHLACLTQIRSIPWLEQCFARTNRVAPGKACGIIYGPADDMFLEAIAMIEAEQRPGLNVGKSVFQDTSSPESAGQGGSRPQVKPLWSSAHVTLQPELGEAIRATIAPSELEKVLRDNIRAIRLAVLQGSRPGSELARRRVFDMTVRNQLGGLALDEADAAALQRAWLCVREKFTQLL